MSLSPHQACFFAHDLTRAGAIGEIDRLSSTLFDSKVDLNPHQVDAALFALSSPLQRGVILADEVGLGKTIEAGLVLCQRWAERRRRLVVVCPAHIRKQWQVELSEKFSLPAMVMDRRSWDVLQRDGLTNPLDCGKVVVMSYGFAARIKDDLRAFPFDLVVMDEAHKLRNAYQASRKGGQAIRWAFELRQKILLTATPLQNSLLELYGLGWLIGDTVFGDKASFQTRYCNAGGDIAGLRERLGMVCKRTLRKDCPYINYKRRQAMTHPFPQTNEERALHDDVLEFMKREVSFAFPQQQRHLIEMILFKALASSPQALASTLQKIRARLIAIRDGAQAPQEDAYIDALTEDEDFDVEGLLESLDDDDGVRAGAAAPVPGRLLAEELAQIDSLIERASRMVTDSKADALLTALQAAFARLQELGAKRKALIFTESRRTQEFLGAFLEANGYAGKVVSFNGSNSHPTAKAAYERYVARHAGTDKLTGSKSVDIRSALIEEFRDHAEILLATEAAAEGVNLQFCSLVVNYDLPWNPQRIEQRIGRCHRYGQQHDVVVVNFLSQDNIADRRVQELLQHKFSLFDGLFGASDQVLGAIESGVDFERRVLGILKSCRTQQEIDEAFDRLSKELAPSINQRMQQAEESLFAHFDDDVRERLRVRGKDAKAALDRVGDRFWRLTRWGLDGQAVFQDDSLSFSLPTPPAPDVPPGNYRLISAVRTEAEFQSTEAHLLRLSSPLGQWLLNRAKVAPCPEAVIRFNVTQPGRRISMVEPLVGKRGWLCLDKVTFKSDAQEEFLVFSGVTDSGENIDQEVLARLMDAPGQLGSPTTIPAAISERLAADAQRLVEATLARAAEGSDGRFRQAQQQVNQWAEDKIAGAEAELERLRNEIRDARRQADIAQTVQQREEAQRRLAELEQERRRKRQGIFVLEDEIEERRNQLIGQLRQQATRSSSSQRLFVARWEAV